MMISFSSGIVCPVADLTEWPLEAQIVERCENMQQSCNVVDEGLNIVGSCIRKGDKYVYTRKQVTA